MDGQEYKYRYEFHLHTTACSGCAVSPMEDYVYKAKETGYAGFVVTNHFNCRYPEGISPEQMPSLWESYVQRYIDDWRAGYEIGLKLDVDVLFGIEAGIGHGKEALIYGLAPEILKAEYRFPLYTTEEKSAFVRSHGAWFAAAHPFRHRWYITEEDAETPPDVSLYDALEIYNEGNLPGENPRAERLAKEHSLAGVGGGDVHDVRKFGNSGMMFASRIRSQADLMDALRNGRYRIIIRGETGRPIE